MGIYYKELEIKILFNNEAITENFFKGHISKI